MLFFRHKRRKLAQSELQLKDEQHQYDYTYQTYKRKKNPIKGAFFFNSKLMKEK
jgi:hypothetical protein